MGQVESKEYSWRWLEEDELLSHGACELCTIVITAKADKGEVRVYDGENTNGDLIAFLECLANRSQEFKPYKPIYCRRGLYVDLIEKVYGVFVQWRELGHKGGD